MNESKIRAGYRMIEEGLRDEPGAKAEQGGHKAECAKCHVSTPLTRLYYIAGENGDEPICGACMADEYKAPKMDINDEEYCDQPCHTCPQYERGENATAHLHGRSEAEDM